MSDLAPSYQDSIQSSSSSSTTPAYQDNTRVRQDSSFNNSNSTIEFVVQKGAGDFFRNDIIKLVGDESTQYYFEIPAPFSLNHWDLKLRKGSEEGEIIITTKGTGDGNNIEIIHSSKQSDGLDNWNRSLKHKGMFKKYWEIQSIENEIWNWENNDKIVKNGFVLVNKKKEVIAVWHSTKLAEDHIGRLSIYPDHSNDVELILSSALVLEEIIRRKPTIRDSGLAVAMSGVSSIGFM